MRLEIDMPEHHYSNIIAFDSVSLGRVPYKGIIMYAINAIKHGKVLEQEPRWIPVSEKLPEDDKDVLIFTIAESIYKACHSLKEWSDDHYEWFVMGTLGWSFAYEEDEVLAWMPLPEPYREVEK